MNESITRTTKHFSPAASLAAIGVKLSQLNLFGPIRTTVQIRQKTIKHTPVDKLYDAFISLLAGSHGLVEIKTRLRTDPALRDPPLAEVRVPSSRWYRRPMSACTVENVSEMQRSLDEIYRSHSQGFRHDYQASLQLLDVDMGCLPWGPKAAFATKGYFA